jgi:tRNA-dihydrouridine synthase A
MLPYIARQLEQHGAQGLKLNGITRHLLGLMTGLPGARAFRRQLSDPAKLAKGDPQLLVEAAAAVLDAA